VKKGRLITFEGGDGAGKTTLIDKVYDALASQGRTVLKTRAPGGTKAGEVIRNLLLTHRELVLHARCELLLFLADRSQHVEEVIRPALARGEIVLCDRFNDSTEAYQGGARHLKIDKVRDLCAFATDGLQPDLTLYLDLDPRIGLERAHKMSGSKDKIESEALEFHMSIREAFHQIAKREPNRFHLLDASLPKEAVYLQAMKYVNATC
jgi:dTMP kinase